MVSGPFAFVSQPRNRLSWERVSMFESLHDHVVILTGAAGLLGRNHCRALAAAGAKVVVADINEAAAKAVVDGLHSVEAMAVAVDVTSPASVSEMVREVVQRFGRIDGLVNNA